MSDVVTYRAKVLADCTDEEVMDAVKHFGKKVDRLVADAKRDAGMAVLFMDSGMRNEAISYFESEAVKCREMGEQIKTDLEKRFNRKEQ